MGAFPSPPPWGWSTGFITTPLTTGRLPSQHLDSALPKFFWFTPTLPTCPTVAKQFWDTKRTSPDGNLKVATYTSDLADDSASSGRSRSTASSVNQPLPGEQAMPPAPPVMQEGANRAPPYVPYPHPVDEIIGGDSVESIQRRLLGTNLNPSAWTKCCISRLSVALWEH
jgi:hypothetical protein